MKSSLLVMSFIAYFMVLAGESFVLAFDKLEKIEETQERVMNRVKGRSPSISFSGNR